MRRALAVPSTVDAAAFLGAYLGMVLLGVGAGLLTGLSPGLHVNNVAALLVATQGSWIAALTTLLPAAGTDSTPAAILVATFLVSAATSHAVFDFVPSVFFGVPTDETAGAALPGPRMLLAGQGVRAVGMAARGATLGCGLAIFLMVPLRLALAEPIGFYDAFRPWAAPVLAGLLVAFLASETRSAGRRRRRVLAAAGIQALAGLLGLAALRGPSGLDADVALFPLFAGLFGAPGLLLASRGPAARIPAQDLDAGGRLGWRDAGTVLRGTFAGAAVSWVPGLSGGAAVGLATLGGRHTRDAPAYMIMLGAVATSTALLSVAVLYIIGRARSGAAAAVQAFLPGLGPWGDPWAVPGDLALLAAASLLGTSVSAPIALRIARALASRVDRADVRRLSRVTLGVLLVLVGLLAGPAGCLLMIPATALGTLPIVARVRRIHLMAALLVPALLSFLAG